MKCCRNCQYHGYGVNMVEVCMMFENTMEDPKRQHCDEYMTREGYTEYLYDEFGNEYYIDKEGNRHYTKDEG